MILDLGAGDLALLATISTDPGKQVEWVLKQIRKALNRQPDTMLLREFEADFWPNYPRKVAVGAARTAYMRARGKVDAGTILRGLAHYNASLRAQETKFIAHASTWLNQERWSDANDPPEGRQTRSVSPATVDPNYGYRSQVQHFLAKGKWCFRGTPPTDPTCLIPREVLREFAPAFAAKGLVIPVLR